MQIRALLQSASHLPLLLAAFPFLAAPSAAEDPKPQRVAVQTADHATLAATFYGTRDVLQKAPAALLVHGAGGSRAELDRLAQRLQKAGFAALTLDLRGHGESATDALNWTKLDPEAQKQAWDAMAGDVQAGVGWLLEQPGVQPSSLCLVGDGAGCALVARHARRDERVRELVLIAPVEQELGASLTKDMAEFTSLPVFIGVGKDDGAVAKRLAEIAVRAGAAESAIEVHVAKAEASKLLCDAKFQGELTRWMTSKAKPEAAAKAQEARAQR